MPRRKMQVRFATTLGFEDYVATQGWRLAVLDRCPLCGPRSCRFERHGTYLRKYPSPSYVTRYYCADQGVTFSLLPDFFASRMRGTLDEIEQVVAKAEEAPSVERAADEIRPGDAEDAVTLPSAIRWVQVRLLVVRTTLAAVVVLLPAMFGHCQATVAAFRERLHTRAVLVALRQSCERHLYTLPAPLGLVPPPTRIHRRCRRLQQSTGLDPPRASG